MFLWSRGQTFAELELRNSFPICSTDGGKFRNRIGARERNQRQKKPEGLIDLAFRNGN